MHITQEVKEDKTIYWITTTTVCSVSWWTHAVLSKFFSHSSYMWLHHYHDSSTQSTLSSFCGQSKMQGGRLSFHPSFYYLFIFLLDCFFKKKKLKIGEIKLNKEWHKLTLFYMVGCRNKSFKVRLCTVDQKTLRLEGLWISQHRKIKYFNAG